MATLRLVQGHQREHFLESPRCWSLPRGRHSVHRMVAFSGLLTIFTLWNTGQERKGSVSSTQVTTQCHKDTREATPTLRATRR